MRENVLLSVKDVSVNYGAGRQDAVEHVSFDVESGEILALVGSNGSGKSTLIKAILGLMPLTCGDIERRHGLRITYLAQIHLAERDFPATVREIVLSGTQEKGAPLLYTRAQRDRARDAMALLGVSALERASIGELSGGQLQRVLLARAVAALPDLMVLDEPCSALDPEITSELYDLFARLKAEKQMTMLIATHDWEYVRARADKVLVLNRSVEYFGDISGWSGKEALHTCHH